MDTIKNPENIFLSWMEELTEFNLVDIYKNLVNFGIIQENIVSLELFERMYSNVFKSLEDNSLQNPASKRSFGKQLLKSLLNS